MKSFLQTISIISVAGFYIILAGISCSKDKSENLSYHDLSFNPGVYLGKVPAGLKESDDPYAGLLYDDINSILDWSEFNNQLKLPDNATKMSSSAQREEYQWSLFTGQYIMLFQLSYLLSGEYYQWDEKLLYGAGLSNNYLKATENKKANEGTLDYNTLWYCGLDPLIEPCVPAYRFYEWNINDDQGLDYSVNTTDFSSIPPVNTEVRMHLEPDGSGYLETYVNTEKYYSATWDILGNGIYTMHNIQPPAIHEWNVE
jgi:hypothetical protein